MNVDSGIRNKFLRTIGITDAANTRQINRQIPVKVPNSDSTNISVLGNVYRWEERVSHLTDVLTLTINKSNSNQS